jgi:Mg2+ and Co2+ transporter CorA
MLVHVDEIFDLLRSERPVDESRQLVVSVLEHAVKTLRGTPATFHRDQTALNRTIGELKAHQDKAAETESVFSSDDIERLEDVISRVVQVGHKARFSEESLSSSIEAYKQKIAPLRTHQSGQECRAHSSGIARMGADFCRTSGQFRNRTRERGRGKNPSD